MNQACDFIVIGAGITGLSIATTLSRHGRVTILERETHPGRHATGRSTPVLIESLGGTQLRALTHASIACLQAHHPEIGDRPLLHPRGRLIIARPDQMQALDTMARANPGFRRLDPEEMELRAPLLRQGHVAAGLLDSRARDIDTPRLEELCRILLHHAGATLACRAEVTGLSRDRGLWEVTSTAGHFRAPIVVNAAGAWIGEIGAMAGAIPVPLQITRRSALLFTPPAGHDAHAMPMIEDVEEAFYVKPDHGRLKASPCDDDPSPPCDARPDMLEIAVCADRIMAAFEVTIERPETTWAWLRDRTPDGAPVCGFDPRAEGFFWLGAQAGIAVQTAPAIAGLAAELITGARPDPELTRHGIDAAELAPERFLMP